jgi:myo-inositol 2-dehydrogenase / D-chiro-inositol 1-dehydrogenase
MANQSTTTSRRIFLKGTTLAASAAIAGTSFSRMAHANGSDEIKIALIGCGGRGTGAAVNALNADPNIKLVAMGDLFADSLNNSLEQLKKLKPEQVAVDKEHQFTGFDAYKKVLESDIDVVLLCAIPHFRPKHFEAAVNAGKHIFCEKPMAIDAPGIKKVMDAVKKSKEKKLNVVAGFCWRYAPAVVATMNEALSGAIGDIRNIEETYITGMVGRSIDRKPEMSEMEYQFRSWYFFNWLSGDHNVEQHIHSLDKASWAMGDKPPISAWGVGGRNLLEKKGNIYDHFGVVYDYGDGVRVNAFSRQQPGCYNSVADHFTGTKGTANILKSVVNGEKKWKYRGPSGNMYDLEHKALFDAIKSGGYVNDGDRMCTSTMLGIIGRMAAYTGQEITWEKALASTASFTPSEYSFKVDSPVMPGPDGKYPVAIPGVTKFV